MALLHHAQLVPSKLELVGAWLPSKPWFEGDADAAFERVGAFRFDDPDGEVGIETLLVRAGEGPVLQVPLTYRGSPLVGAEQWLIGTMEHSVLGARWVYDGAGDAVYLGELARAALGLGREVEQFYEEDGQRVASPPLAQLRGGGVAGFEAPSAHDDHVPDVRDDGASTLVGTDRLAFVIARAPVAHPIDGDSDSSALTGTWINQDRPSTLALVSLRK